MNTENKLSANTQESVNREDLEFKVKKMYREVALNPEGEFHFEMGRELAERLGYPAAVLDRIPAEAVDSFAGVGYYFHLAEIAEGERVVDLGSGSGMDSFIASLNTGHSGKVTGIDMTDEQLEKAQTLRDRHGFKNVQFRKGYIENLPLPDTEVEVVISNGVINLSADKEQVFLEAARVLRPGGRLILSDIVSVVELPQKISCNVTLWASCIGGAVQADKYVELLEKAGLKVVFMEDNPQYQFISEGAKGATKNYGIKSISLLAIKK